MHHQVCQPLTPPAQGQLQQGATPGAPPSAGSAAHCTAPVRPHPAVHAAAVLQSLRMPGALCATSAEAPAPPRRWPRHPCSAIESGLFCRGFCLGLFDKMYVECVAVTIAGVISLGLFIASCTPLVRGVKDCPPRVAFSVSSEPSILIQLLLHAFL